MSGMYDPSLSLGKPTPQGKRPWGLPAWLIGIAVWIAIIVLLGALFWLVS